MRRSSACGKALRGEQGQAMTEFALVLPVLVVVLFAIVQFGIVFNHFVALTDAVRAGARKAAVSRQTNDPVAVAKNAVIAAGGNIAIDPSDITVTSDWQAGDDVTVKATMPASLNLGLLTITLPALHSSTTERVE
jgi:Flp pilus assembly protein TadG